MDCQHANHGSIILLTPLTELAKDWVGTYLPDDLQWFGGGVAIEPRYFDNIADGIQEGGLTIA